MIDHRIIIGDCLEIMRGMDDDAVDLVVTSPPYEAARTYGINFALNGQEWADWALERYMECVRVCRGAVCWVVAGRTRGYKWSASPALLIADLHRAGVNLRNPLIYKRHGIPGSGGPDWFSNKYEWIICASKPGRLPWSDNTAMGHAPKYGPGGPPSHRTTGPAGYSGGDMRVKNAVYKPPKIANPGNVIDIGSAGKNKLGSDLAHENEAPFPEQIPEFLIRSLCQPGGVVLDPFSGSGTTAKVAGVHGRRSISIDIRESQIVLAQQRLKEIND